MSVVTYIKQYKYATFGVAGWISLAVKYNGHVYRGIGPFYNSHPEDHIISEDEDVYIIDDIVCQTLNHWDGLCLIEDNVITIPLFYEVPKYKKNPQYYSTKGNQFATLLYLHQDAKIRQDIPWRM